jgi:hypothetical protein
MSRRVAIGCTRACYRHPGRMSTRVTVSGPFQASKRSVIPNTDGRASFEATAIGAQRQ